MSLGLLRALLITDPLVILSTIFFGSINLLVSLFETTGRMQVAIARVWSKSLLLLANVKMDFDGIEKIDPDGSYVFASNHLSYMDTPVVLAHIPVQFRFLAKKGLFSIPFLGYHLTRAGHIPVPREDPRGAIKTMNLAAQIIRERDISVLIFPEGGRTRDGELQPFKEGAAHIAIQAGVPIVPIALDGTREVLPMGSLNIRPGRVVLRIGDPIPTTGLTTRDRGKLTAQVREKIVEMMEARKKAPVA